MPSLDFLIEVHDFIDITISETLRQVFSEGFSIETVESVDDIRKAKTYTFPELAGIELARRHRLVGENRPAIMEWFFVRRLDLVGGDST
jgi:hypothetical protein